MTGLRCRLTFCFAAAAVMLVPSTSSADSRTDVQDALAAGRYADAVEAAQAESDPAIRAALTSQIVAAQTATATPRVPRTAAAATAPALNGGTNADFGELIDLIQNQTGETKRGKRSAGPEQSTRSNPVCGSTRPDCSFAPRKLGPAADTCRTEADCSHGRPVRHDAAVDVASHRFAA